MPKCLKFFVQINEATISIEREIITIKIEVIQMIAALEVDLTTSAYYLIVAAKPIQRIILLNLHPSYCNI